MKVFPDGLTCQSTRGSIGDESSRHNANTTTTDLMEELGNRLDLGIVERVGRGIGVNTKSVDGTFVTGVQGSGRIGRVSDVGIKAMSPSRGKETVSMSWIQGGMIG